MLATVTNLAEWKKAHQQQPVAPVQVDPLAITVAAMALCCCLPAIICAMQIAALLPQEPK